MSKRDDQREVHSTLYTEEGQTSEQWNNRIDEAKFQAQDDGWDGVELRIIPSAKGLHITGYPPE